MDSDIPLHIDIRSIRTRNATMLQPPSAKANTNSQASFIHFPENRELSCRVSTLDGFFKIKKFTFCWTAAFASAISVLRGGKRNKHRRCPDSGALSGTLNQRRPKEKLFSSACACLKTNEGIHLQLLPAKGGDLGLQVVGAHTATACRCTTLGRGAVGGGKYMADSLSVLTCIFLARREQWPLLRSPVANIPASVFERWS